MKETRERKKEKKERREKRRKGEREKKEWIETKEGKEKERRRKGERDWPLAKKCGIQNRKLSSRMSKQGRLEDGMFGLSSRSGTKFGTHRLKSHNSKG